MDQRKVVASIIPRVITSKGATYGLVPDPRVVTSEVADGIDGLVPVRDVESTKNEDQISSDVKSKICQKIPNWFVAEFKELLSLAWYLSVINLFSNIMGTLSVTFCGHLGTVELDGVSLACSIFNVFGIQIASGLCTACDTLFSQSFGSSNKKKVGIYLQQSLVIIPLFVLPCWGLHLNVKPLLILIGNTPAVADIAGRYLMIMMPGTLALFLLRLLTTFLRSQNVLWPTLVAGVLGAVTNIVGHLVALYALNTGIEGSAVVHTLAFVMMLAFTGIYILWSGMYKPTWPGWGSHAFDDWGRFLYIGVAGMLMLFGSVFCQETGSFFAGSFGETALGAQSILFNTQTITFTIPFGFAIACNIRLGQLLGSQEPVRARRAAMMGLGVGAITTIVIAVVGTLMRQILPLLFTGDSEVIAATADAYPVMFLNYIFDGITVCFLGVLRGCNKESLATVITFVGYYAIGLPLAVLMMFFLDYGITGFWWGLAIGMMFNTVLFIVALYKMDYEQGVKLAQARAGVTVDVTDRTAKHRGSTAVLQQQSLAIRSAESDDGDDDESENTALLTYKAIAQHRTIKRLQMFHQTLYGHNPHISRSSLYIPVTAEKDLDTRSATFIYVTRASFIVLMISLLAVGVAVRFSLPEMGDAIASATTSINLPAITTLSSSASPV